VVWPVPFGFASYPRSWVGALDSVIARAPGIVMPGHGPVERDPAFLHHERDMLSRIVEAADAGRARGDSLRAVGRALPMTDDLHAVPLDAKWSEFLFQQFFRRPVISRAFENAHC